MAEARLPTEDTVARILQYLGENDEAYAKARTKLKVLEKDEKVILAQAFLNCPKGTSATEANTVKYNDPLYKKWRNEYEDAMIEFTLLDEKRERYKTVISFWQSLNKARSQGGHI